MNKQNIADLHSIYKPRKRRKPIFRQNKLNQSTIQKAEMSNISMSKLPIKTNHSPKDLFKRSHSVLKSKEEFSPFRHETKSVEPFSLPPIRERSLDPKISE